MNAIFHITGGLGKHILASAVINSYKDQNPSDNIIVSSAYPNIFYRNPNVSESLNINTNQYFYKNYIYNKEAVIFAQEPYKQTSHLLKQKHLIDTWCSMVGVDRSANPTIHPNFREIEITKNKIVSTLTKPLLIFQPFGGPQNQELSYCWARDIHPNIAQQIVDEYKDEYDVIHVCNKQHPYLNNCIRLDERLNTMVLLSLLLFSSKRILIDSCLQHASYALGLQSTVLWVVTNPNVFGYEEHTNIIANRQYLEGHAGSYLFDYEITGIVPECPYSDYNEIFNINQILQTI